MALYSSSYLKNITEGTSLDESRKMFSETRSKISFDIFLSHSFLDKDLIMGLYIDLNRMGYSVCVDWIVDPQLDRSNVTKETSILVPKRLRSSKSLLLAISVNASMSKWMPWELGFVDGHTGGCAIIPVSDSLNPPRYFNGAEYLSLYPFVSREFNIQNVMKLWVVEEANRYVSLKEWLSGSKPSLKLTKIF